jgi:hypothetical protein
MPMSARGPGRASLAIGIAAPAQSDVKGPMTPITLSSLAKALALEAHLVVASELSSAVESSQAW